MSLRQWRAHLQTMAWRHGWCGMVAVPVLAANALFYGTWVRPAQDALRQADIQLATTSPPPAMPARPPAAAAASSAPSNLSAVLRPAAEALPLVRQLGALAADRRISVERGEYTAVPVAGTDLLQVQVHQPVKAGYAPLKAYLAAALRAHPNLSLDQLAASREHGAAGELDVRLRWTFWLREGAAAPAPASRGGTP